MCIDEPPCASPAFIGPVRRPAQEQAIRPVAPSRSAAARRDRIERLQQLVAADAHRLTVDQQLVPRLQRLCPHCVAAWPAGGPRIAPPCLPQLPPPPPLS